jgi:8-oxo-dGTP diphosphatase
MPARSSSARTLARVVTITVDVVLFTPQGNALAALVLPVAGRARSRDRWVLPSGTLQGAHTLDDTAARVAHSALGRAPSFLDQALTTAAVDTPQERTDLTVTYFGLVPSAPTLPSNRAMWIPSTDAGGLSAGQNVAMGAALAAMRARLDQQPIAFRLLPLTFTLSELQSVYELLLGRRLHKASFRRALHASSLVEATDEWRSEGRGRPAQLFRYMPPRRKRQRRGVRFDLLN